MIEFSDEHEAFRAVVRDFAQRELAPHVERWEAAAELPLEAVSVKATRPEGLGLAGDGVGCMAVAVLL